MPCGDQDSRQLFCFRVIGHGEHIAFIIPGAQQGLKAIFPEEFSGRPTSLTLVFWRDSVFPVCQQDILWKAFVEVLQLFVFSICHEMEPARVVSLQEHIVPHDHAATQLFQQLVEMFEVLQEQLGQGMFPASQAGAQILGLITTNMKKLGFFEELVQFQYGLGQEISAAGIADAPAPSAWFEEDFQLRMPVEYGMFS